MKIGSHFDDPDKTPDLSAYTVHSSEPIGKGKGVAILVAEFNATVTNRLLEGSLKGLVEHDVDPKNIHIKYVPGAFELPLAALHAIRDMDIDAVICLGCVIRGDTAHFDFVAGECARGIMDVSLDTETPVIFGVLTTETPEQAMERAQEDKTNKGYEAAITALQMS
ncbi:6,7-dimethyl-8-ribityllumazine synthase [bacterium]|jgi:6,7-dimethyl-8-ribityllumazine synthase|nr:6,7-dimethyl-8-ribityllumazine synthase [bacterium]